MNTGNLEKYPKISIAVCTHNGGATLAQTLKSLNEIKYPKNQLEIVVVNDGSRDNSAQIARNLGFKVHSHKHNLGLAAARNTGLKKTFGEIYVCFDDDCIADKEWLANLASIYLRSPSIAGVGGRIKDTTSGSITAKYLSAVNYGDPAPMQISSSTTPLQRLLTFILIRLKSKPLNSNTAHEVFEIMGGNSSFRRSVIENVDGWNGEMAGVEDADICARIRKAYPAAIFIYNPRAVISHDHKLSMAGLLSRAYRRGPKVYNFYRSNKMLPPIFPFPVVFILICIIATLCASKYLLIYLLIAPPLLYWWWILKAAQSKKSYYIIFPYIELAFHTASLVGILQGFYDEFSNRKIK